MASETSSRARPTAAAVARSGGPRHRFSDPVRRRGRRAGAFLVHNTLANLERQNIATGFGFLGREAAFGIGESLIAYSPADSYARAFLVGLTNTLYVAALGIVLATILGTVMGLARLSSNWLIAKLAQIYVETFRNIPLALQLFFWWGLLRGSAPAPRQAWQPLPDVFVSNRGIVFPVPQEDPAHPWMLGALVVAIVAAWAIARWARLRQARTGQQFPSGWAGLALVFGLPLAVFLAAGAPLSLDVPALHGFNFTGGTAVFARIRRALLIGLVIYTGSFIAEIVRAGILAVSWGQSEAAMALGLTPWQRMRLIVLPQALRVIVPPMTSQYLSLTKNSSLAVVDRLSRPRVDRQHDDEPDRPGDRRHHDDHGGLSRDQPRDLAVDEPLQPRRRAGRALGR